MIGKKPGLGRDTNRMGTKIVPAQKKQGKGCRVPARSMRKLKELLCPLGHKTDGEGCRTCISVCGYGKEYRQRKADGEG